MFWSFVMKWSPKLRGQFLGTMGFSVTAASGAAAITLLTPWTSGVCYDAPDENGVLSVRVAFDHRVYDGKIAARGLAEIERELLTTILAELKPAPHPVAKLAA